MSFSKTSPFSKSFSSALIHKASVFKFLQLEERFPSVLDLPQVDCENAKASDSQDDESEGLPHLSNLADTGFGKV